MAMAIDERTAKQPANGKRKRRASSGRLMVEKRAPDHREPGEREGVDLRTDDDGGNRGTVVLQREKDRSVGMGGLDLGGFGGGVVVETTADGLVY